MWKKGWSSFFEMDIQSHLRSTLTDKPDGLDKIRVTGCSMLDKKKDNYPRYQVSRNFTLLNPAFGRATEGGIQRGKVSSIFCKRA
jgi:hypothetical protein